MSSTFLKCSQMFRVFYHSVILSSGFLICSMINYIKIMWQKNNITPFFCVLYSYKTRLFDKSEHAQDTTCIFIINRNNIQNKTHRFSKSLIKIQAISKMFVHIKCEPLNKGFITLLL